MTARRPGVAVLVGAWRGWRSKCKMLAACRAAFSTPKILGRSLLLAIATSPILHAASAHAAAANDQGGQIAAVCTSCHRLDGGEKGDQLLRSGRAPITEALVRGCFKPIQYGCVVRHGPQTGVARRMK